jgi:hypothetical protein
MKALRFGYHVLCLTIFCGFFLFAYGCELGQTVMVSKGEAGGFSEAFGGNSQYCKMTMTPGATISEAAQEAFVKYCADVE